MYVNVQNFSTSLTLEKVIDFQNRFVFKNSFFCPIPVFVTLG